MELVIIGTVTALGVMALPRVLFLLTLVTIRQINRHG